MAQLQGNEYTQVTSINSCASHEYAPGYLSVEGLRGLELVQDCN